jgi:iron-sulfur cluster repair protein YtfE (RIC family)
MATAEKEWMDPIQRVISERAEVSQYVETMKDLLAIIKKPHILDKIRSIKEFFSRNLQAHFEFEERVVFPVIESHIGNKQYQLLLQELKTDYDILLRELQEFNNLFDASMESHNHELFIELSKIGEHITDRLLRHAAKEDDELLPIIKEHIELFERVALENELVKRP